MFWRVIKVSMVAVAVVAFSGVGSARVAAQTRATAPAAGGPSHVPKEFLTRPPNIVRTIKDSQDLGGYTLSVAYVTVPPGGREGRHKHQGILIGYVVSGVLSMDHEPTGVREYHPGETFYIPEGQIHEGYNAGKEQTVVIGSFLIKKGAPMADQMPLP